jgi:signal transduction histidine kinase
MGHMRGVLAQTLDGIHKLIHDLRPSMLDHLGLFVALRWYADTRLKPVNMRLRVEEHGTLRRLPPQMETALFRVGQEAINNIARHSGARNVRLKFDGQDGTLHIEIRDDGIGFDLIEVEHSADRQRGLGLAGMQERVGLLGGQIHIISTPGHGTQVSISVPMEHV